MNPLVLVALPISLVLGFVLGSIPGLNDYLHWNLWYVIPVSGLLFGLAAGWLLFELCFLLHAKVNGAAIAVIGLSVVLGYIAVDVGIYYQKSIDVTGIEGLSDGKYKLSELMTLGQFFQMQLGSSTIESRHGNQVLEMGATGSTLSYLADLVGALLGAAGLAFGMADLRPYCNRCRRYKRRTEKLSLMLQNNVQASEVQTNIKGFVRSNDFAGLSAYVEQVAPQLAGSTGKFKIDMDWRHCPRCRQTTVIGRVYRQDRKGWSEMDNQRFSLSSESSEAVV